MCASIRTTQTHERAHTKYHFMQLCECTKPTAFIHPSHILHTDTQKTLNIKPQHYAQYTSRFTSQKLSVAQLLFSCFTPHTHTQNHYRPHQRTSAIPLFVCYAMLHRWHNEPITNALHCIYTSKTHSIIPRLVSANVWKCVCLCVVRFRYYYICKY